MLIWPWPSPRSRSRSWGFWISENCTFQGISHLPVCRGAPNWWLIMVVCDQVYSFSEPDYWIFPPVSGKFTKCWYHQNPLGFICMLPETRSLWSWMQVGRNKQCTLALPWPRPRLRSNEDQALGQMKLAQLQIWWWPSAPFGGLLSLYCGQCFKFSWVLWQCCLGDRNGLLTVEISNYSHGSLLGDPAQPEVTLCLLSEVAGVFEEQVNTACCRSVVVRNSVTAVLRRHSIITDSCQFSCKSCR